MFDGQKDVVQNEAPTKASGCNQASTLGGAIGGSAHSHTHGLRKQLWERQRKLQRDLNEVQDAINILDNDETVNKVLKVFDVAGK